MAEQPRDWFGVCRRILDLWLALQLTVGVGLLIGVGAVIDYSTGLHLLVSVVAPFLLALGFFLTDRIPETGPLWTGGFAVLGAALGVSLLSTVLGVSAPEHVLYLTAVVLVSGIYGTHRTLKYLARSTAPK